MIHYDGGDVIVLSDLGYQVREVDEVRIEYDRAVVHVRCGPQPALSTCTGRLAVYSASDGRPYFTGSARVVGV